MKCQVVLDDARKELNDPEEVRWSQVDLLSYLNDALQAVALMRPDAYATTSSVQLSTGTKQALPTGGTRLLKVTRNMGSNGTTAGRPIQLTDMATLDAMSTAWHTSAGAGTVYEYCYDPAVPKQFWVYPGVSSTTYVEIAYVAPPTAITNPRTTDLPVDDSLSPALREWVLYRAWGGDDESSPNAQQARDRRQAFLTLIGVKSQSDAAVTPRIKEAR